MKSGRCGSSSLASCLAMGLCTRPWKSLGSAGVIVTRGITHSPASIPIDLMSARR